MSRVLVTGGTGFIGSHTCSVLLHAGYELIILDSLINSSLEVIDRLNNIQSIQFFRFQTSFENFQNPFRS